MCKIIRGISLIVSLIFVTTSILFAQTQSKIMSLPPTAKLKTIKYIFSNIYNPNINEYFDYGAIGYVIKNKFVTGQKLTFLTKSYDQTLVDEFLSGKYYCSEDGNSFIDGVWKCHKDNSGINDFILKGRFKITNNSNRIGITADKRKGDKLTILIEDVLYFQKYNIVRDTIILRKISDKTYSLKINSLTLETAIPNLNTAIQNNNYSFNKYIEESHHVKLTYKNGDIFIGKVENEYGYDTWKAKEGEYRFANGEIFVGDLKDWIDGMPYNGKMTFSDGSTEEGFWLSKYGVSREDISKGNTITEKHNIAIRLYEEKQRKQQEEKITKVRASQEKLRLEKALQLRLITKYGDYWGNLIYKKEYTPGMTKEMIIEFSSEILYKISKVIRNGNSIEIWEFDRQKMELATLKESGEDGAKALLALSLLENLGFGNINSQFPTLVFTNGKLTDVYQK